MKDYHRDLISDRFTRAVQAVKTLNRIKDTIEPVPTLVLVNEDLEPYKITWNEELKQFELETVKE